MTTTTTSTTNTIHLPGTPTFAEWSAIMRNLHADVLAGSAPRLGADLRARERVLTRQALDPA